MLLGVLFNALIQYRFDGSQLWSMPDGKDHARIEVTVRNQPTNTSTRRGTKVGGGLTTTTKPTPARRPKPSVGKETLRPLSQTLPDTTRSAITHDRTQKTAIIEIAPVIKKPTPPPSSPNRPPKKKEDKTQLYA